MHCCLLAVVYSPSDTYVWLLGKGLALRFADTGTDAGWPSAMHIRQCAQLVCLWRVVRGQGKGRLWPMGHSRHSLHLP
jgi:hypothetical protein